MTRSPVVGRRFRWIREDLYEQCSDHITENTPNSTAFGSRPSSSLTRVNSSGVRLCAAMTSGVIDSIDVGGRNFGVRWQAKRDTALACFGSLVIQSAVAALLCRRTPKLPTACSLPYRLPRAIRRA